MAFFLIGKGPGETLRLLADGVFESRAAAMSELSRLTADPGFDQWDDEVLVADLDAATPVLLVRPALPAGSKAAQDTAESDEGSEVQTSESGSGTSKDDEIAEDASEADESLAAVIEGLDDDAADTDGGLKEALQRTAVSLEAEGIVAPESVGPAEPVVESPDAPDEAAGSELAAPDVEDVDVGETAADETHSDELAVELSSDAMVVEADTEGGVEAAWPWAVRDDARPFDLDALEDPGDDMGSLVRAPGDDETMASARPVILGAYDQPEPPADVDVLLPEVVHESPGVEPDSTRDELPDVQPPAIPIPPQIPVPPPLPDQTPAPAPASDQPSVVVGSMGVADQVGSEGRSVEAHSDFVDLPPIVATDPIDTMTCDDCVYTDTCPNKDQREPASCGSFQWK